MDKNTKKIIAISSVTAVAVTATLAATYFTTKLLASIALDREAPPVIKKAGNLISGSKNNDDISKLVADTGGKHVDAVVKGAAAGLRAAVAGDAAGDRLAAHPVPLGPDAFPMKLGFHLTQGGVGTAVLVGAAVEEEDFHGLSLPFRPWPRPRPGRSPSSG